MNVSGIATPSAPSIQLSGGSLFIQYAYLQALDVLSTLAFMTAGVEEANPLVRVAISFLGSPLAGLVIVKVGALVLGLLCWRQGRIKLLRKVNFYFSALVVWNLCCLIIGLAEKIKG